MVTFNLSDSVKLKIFGAPPRTQLGGRGALQHPPDPPAAISPVFSLFRLECLKNSNLFDKNCTQENIKCHIQHEEIWLRWVVIEQVNYKKHYSAYIYLKEIVFAHFEILFGRSNRDAFGENEENIHEGGCVKEFFFVNLQVGISQLH